MFQMCHLPDFLADELDDLKLVLEARRSAAVAVGVQNGDRDIQDAGKGVERKDMQKDTKTLSERAKESESVRVCETAGKGREKGMETGFEVERAASRQASLTQAHWPVSGMLRSDACKVER